MFHLWQMLQKAVVNRVLLETMFFFLLCVIQIEHLYLLGYVIGVTKAGIRPMNVSQQGTVKLCHWETP